MVVIDPVIGFLTHTRNANMVKHKSLKVPASRVKRGIAGILRCEGLARDIKYIEDDRQGMIRIFLEFGKNGERVITNLRRISKSGLRAYVKADEVLKVLNGSGIAIVLTSEGVVTDRGAHEKNIGNEVIAYVR